MQNVADSAVSVRGLSAGYGRKAILEDVSFEIPYGKVFAILGGSGCGKSTLLKNIIGLYKPLKGDVLIEGRSIVNASDDEKRSIMRGFGVAYQGGALFRALSLGENISLPMEEQGKLSPEEIEAAVKAKLALVNLDGFEDYMPSDLSGGMVKRAAFARALALDPKLLFFDEPSAGLDPISSAQLDRLILDIRDRTGATIILVTHELPSIFAVADYVIMLDRNAKGIIAQGSPSELRDLCPVEAVRDFMNRFVVPSSSGSASSNMAITNKSGSLGDA